MYRDSHDVQTSKEHFVFVSIQQLLFLLNFFLLSPYSHNTGTTAKHPKVISCFYFYSTCLFLLRTLRELSNDS